MKAAPRENRTSTIKSEQSKDTSVAGESNDAGIEEDCRGDGEVKEDDQRS